MEESSGAEGARTPGLRAASATLSQLSYSPIQGIESLAQHGLVPPGGAGR